MLFKLSFLIRRLAKEEGILPLFLICVGYSAPSVFITRATCECGMQQHLFCVVALWTSSASGSERDSRCSSLWDKMSRVHLGVQPQQQCQLNLPRLCVTTIVNKDYQLKSAKVTLHSHRHSLTPSK
jgi:hypothetical protein